MSTFRPGDRGQTKDARGQEVDKSSEQVEAYGRVDELTSVLGWARQDLHVKDKQRVFWLQEQLQMVAACLAGAKMSESDILSFQKSVDTMAEWTEELQKELPPLRQFVVPGSSERNARLHMARTVARTAERSAVRCRDAGFYPAEAVLPILNRTSDFLFVLARTYERDS